MANGGGDTAQGSGRLPREGGHRCEGSGLGVAAADSLPGISRTREALLVGALILYAGAIWVWGVGGAEIHESMEGSRAVVAQGMMRSGDYVVPRRGIEVYMAKPPLFYWAVTLTSRLWGRVTETSVRLVSALCGMAVLLVTYYGVRPRLGWKTAFVAALVAATSPLVFEAATVGRVNMMLALGVALSLFGAFYMLESPKRGWVYAVVCGVGLSIGLLTKGPVVLMFFVPTVILYVGFQQDGPLAKRPGWSVAYFCAMAFLAWLARIAYVRVGLAGAALYPVAGGMLVYFGLAGEGRKAWNRQWLVVMGVALLLSIPWPIALIGRLGLEPLVRVFKTEFWELNTSQIGASNWDPIWLYAVRLPAATLPYSLFLLPAFAPGRASQGSDSGRRMLLLARCWLVASIVLFTVVSPARKIRYILPVFPAVSVLAAYAIESGSAGRLRPWMNRYVGFLGVLLTYLICMVPVAIPAAWLVMGRAPAALAVAATAVTGTGAVLGVYLHRVRRSRWAWLAALVVAVLGVKIFVQFGYADVAREEGSVRAACASVRSGVPADATLYIYGFVETEVIFYLNAEPLETHLSGPSGLEGQERVFVCLEAAGLDAFQPPEGFRKTELKRVTYGEDQLLLLELERQAAPEPVTR